jgi:hypothetical protein
MNEVFNDSSEVFNGLSNWHESITPGKKKTDNMGLLIPTTMGKTLLKVLNLHFHSYPSMLPPPYISRRSL